MYAGNGQISSPSGHRGDQMTAIVGNDSKVENNAPREWSESRKKFLQQHQEKYLQRLTKLRETLVKEKDLVRLSLPKTCDKTTGFWEVIMADFAEASPHHKFPGAKAQRPYQTSAGGRLSGELNRRGHLERLRRIRIMQMRRKLPPQLEPLHGVGLITSRTNDKTDGNRKPMSHIPPTKYHVDWMRGNHLVTPMADQDKIVNAWTLKHIRLIDPDLSHEIVQSPVDVRTLLRKKSSTDSTTKLRHPAERRSYVAPASTPTNSRQNKRSASTKINAQSLTKEPEPSTQSSTPVLRAESISIPYKLPPSPQTPFMTEIISHHSSSSSRMESSNKELIDESLRHDSDGSVDDDQMRPAMVDRASSPVGFRLPPLERSTRTSVSSSANSKRHIVVKIPDGNK